MSRFVRASKYRYDYTRFAFMVCHTDILHRHVYGSAAKKELSIDNLKLSNSAWDTNLVAASGVSCKFLSRYVYPAPLYDTNEQQ